MPDVHQRSLLLCGRDNFFVIIMAGRMVNIADARFELGGSRVCSQCSEPGNRDCVECKGAGRVATPWSRNYVAFIKSKMGISGRYFSIDRMKKFIEENPNLKMGGKTPSSETFRSLLSEAYELIKDSGPRGLVERIRSKLQT